jgi:hypothetical protein
MGIAADAEFKMMGGVAQSYDSPDDKVAGPLMVGMGALGAVTVGSEIAGGIRTIAMLRSVDRVAGVVNESGKSIKAAVGNINKAGLNQKEALSAVQDVAKSDGRTSEILQGADGAQVAIGGKAYLNIGGVTPTAAVNVAKDGTSSFGTASVQVSKSGTDLVKTVVDFKPAELSK